MGTGSASFIILGLGFLLCIRNVEAQYYMYHPNMGKMCNQSMQFDCPFTYAGRAGTFRYYRIPDLSPGLCFFSVTLPADCGIPSDRFAFYFNIRKFLLPSTDRVRIYQTYSLEPRILLKEMTGSHSARSDPSSAAQALTSYVKQPSFTIEYFRDTSPATESHQADIDFVTVENNPDKLRMYCTALSGYVDVYYICHTDGIEDRVNCPDSFTADVYAENPAYLRSSCPFKSPPTFLDRRPLFDYWNSQDAPGSYLSSDAFRGIGFGCVLFVVMLLTAVEVVRSARRRRSPSRPIVLPLTSGTVPREPLLTVAPHDAASRPAVLDDPVIPFDPPPLFPGAPPSYSQVTAPPALVGISMSNPPSYKSCI